MCKIRNVIFKVVTRKTVTGHNSDGNDKTTEMCKHASIDEIRQKYRKMHEIKFFIHVNNSLFRLRNNNICFNVHKDVFNSVSARVSVLAVQFPSHDKWTKM